VQVNDPLALLRATPQWILVRLVPRAGGKTDKLPVDPRTMQVTTKGAGGAHDPAIWMPHATAAALLPALGASYCLGFVLTAQDPFWCLDIDDAVGADGQWKPIVKELTDQLSGTAIEVSQSGRGLHIWGAGPVPEHGKKNTALHIELYTELRFIALGRPDATGDIAPVCPGIAAVAARYFPVAAAMPAGPALADDGPREDWRGPKDDEELIRRMLRSRSAASVLGGKASAADLWEANIDVLARAFPPDSGSGEPFDRSSADMALAAHLAFWTGCDAERMRRLMWESKLARPKWERDDYLVGRTIGKACASQRDVCQDAPVELHTEVAEAVAAYTGELPEMRPTQGSTMLYAEGQSQLFKGCVYIIELHRVMVPGGKLLKPDQFRSVFGGYIFVMTADGSKTTRNAFEAFTESTILRCPQADNVMFRPSLPYGVITEVDGQRLANQWWPVEIRRVAGDPAPYLEHLRRLLPNERDRRIVLSYQARMVQSPGVKAQWALVLQGVEGNGKTLISRVSAYGAGRRYVHWPKASKLTAQFNGWMVNKLFYPVEDIHTSEGSDVLEELKPMITGTDGLEIEKKGVDQFSGEVVGNFILNSNHKTALRKTRNDRRLCILFCAQQEAEDLGRDGMDEHYMTALYDWLRADGFAILYDYLMSYPVDAEFDFAGTCQRAPRTSSTEAAIALGLGRVEQEILEAIDEGRVGFMDGWVSSHYLDALLEGMGRASAVPRNRRRDLMRSLGYDWHPALKEGRVHNLLAPDGAKSRLYVKSGHPALSIKSAADVARAYSQAQGHRPLGT